MSVIIWVNNYNASGLSSSFNSKYFYKKQWKMDNDNYIINKKMLYNFSFNGMLYKFKTK